MSLLFPLRGLRLLLFLHMLSWRVDVNVSVKSKILTALSVLMNS